MDPPRGEVNIAGRAVPLVVSPAGTDIHADWTVATRRDIMLQVFRSARAIVAQGPGTVERLKEILPDSGSRVFPVPKSVLWFGEDPYQLRNRAGFRPGDVIFFVPAGIRPVKRNVECLTAFEKIRAVRSRARAVFAGPELDAAYAARFLEQMHRCAESSSSIPLIPPASMRSAYEGADVVLNASLSEGLSDSLLESMASGRPVLASDIPGNRELIRGEQREEPAGLLFNPHDPEDFLEQAVRLVDDRALRDSLGRAGMRRAAAWPGPLDEAEGLLRAYES